MQKHHLLGMLINPTPVQASTIEGEPCSIWWVDKSVDGWPPVTVTWVDSCPRSCPQDVAGDFHNQSDTWCADLTPPPNLPGVYLGNACSADSSRSVTLLTDGTFGTNFEIEGNGQVVAGTFHTFTGIPEGLFTARGQAHNSKGSSGWSSPVSAQHDYSAPVTTADVVGLSQNGWYVSPVSVSFNANDVGCFGVNQTLYAVNGVQNSYLGSPFTIADDGIHTLQYRSTDGYHLEAEKSGIIPIDSTAPTLQFILDRPQDVAGWWTAPLSITIFADDATSGLASLEYDLNGAGWVSGDSLTLTDGVHTLDAQATDNAGHLSYDGVILPIDSTPPLLNVQITGEQGENSWFIAPPTLTLSATDANSGVAGVLYQIENGSQELYTAPINFNLEGLYIVQTFAVDNAQHITTQTVQIGYDITQPQTNAQLTETEDGMTITLNRWDGVSGFAFTRVAINGVWSDYHHPITVSETGDYWVQFYTIDFAGNIEAEKIMSFTVAETGVVLTQAPPVVNIVPPANPPNTPPFETNDDFPPDLHNEGVYFTYPEDNHVADTAYPPSPIIFAGGNTNNGSSVMPMENRISRSPVIRESDMTTNTIPLFPLEGRFPTDRQPRLSTLPYTDTEITAPPMRLSNPARPVERDYLESPFEIAPQPTSNIVFVSDTTSAQGASETPSSPLDVTMLAMLGLTMAGAGVMKSQSAQKKQHELAQANAVAQAQLATAKAEQAQTASANWEQNQTMQANATKKVYTKVQQSQANIDFWASYVAWQVRVLESERKRQIEAINAKIQALYYNLGLAQSSSANLSNFFDPIYEAIHQFLMFLYHPYSEQIMNSSVTIGLVQPRSQNQNCPSPQAVLYAVNNNLDTFVVDGQSIGTAVNGGILTHDHFYSNLYNFPPNTQSTLSFMQNYCWLFIEGNGGNIQILDTQHITVNHPSFGSSVINTTSNMMNTYFPYTAQMANSRNLQPGATLLYPSVYGSNYIWETDYGGYPRYSTLRLASAEFRGNANSNAFYTVDTNSSPGDSGTPFHVLNQGIVGTLQGSEQILDDFWGGILYNFNYYREKLWVDIVNWTAP
ncbi:MAG: hypothetical protein KJ043_02345 [Anaerolineae bacterium]|nr:hypothetical protein [Anaerolineae bacterium]